MDVDGALCSSTGAGGVGVLIRDHNAQVLLAAWCVLPMARDVEEAEAMAVREGLRYDAEIPELQVMRETDCSSVC